jgi:hypothetical protein
MTDASAHARRTPAWSQHLTRPAARLIPGQWRPATLVAIKAIHTLIFASVGSTILLFVWDGLRGRPRRRTAYAMGVALGEAAVYVSNNQVCPLTPLAEELGAESGSVVDIFLPDRVARRIPVVSSAALVVGLALNLRALLAGGRRDVGAATRRTAAQGRRRRVAFMATSTHA